MSCPKGKASPDTQTRLRLFADSGGHCQNPNCLADLFVQLSSENVHIAEMAHVFSASNEGPRANRSLSKVERGAYDNLIILCPRCHTIVDKAEQEYPESLLLKWKREHKQRIEETFGVVEYATRMEARASIDPLLVENHTIFETYGPNTPERLNPESDSPVLWKRKILTKLLPNNRQILRILDRNRMHLRTNELPVLERFRQHVDDFEGKHLGETSCSGIPFPNEMERILA
jgi:hypothetical protein